MTVITRPLHGSSALVRSDVNHVTSLSPVFTRSLYLATFLPRLLSTTTIFLTFRVYLLTAILLRQSFSSSQYLLVQTYYACVILTEVALLRAKTIMNLGWRATENLRKKLFFEFMVFLLGGGYGLLLIILWPGWIVVGIGALVLWWVRG